MLEKIILLIVVYLIASIPNALWVGKVFKNTDIRNSGSGNLGSTNAARVLGKKIGAFVLLLDGLKGFLPLLIIKNIYYSPFIISIFMIVAVLGHSYPIFLKFKGGKSVAIMFGIYLATFPYIFLACVITFFIVFKLSKYVSLSSIISAGMAPVYFCIFYIMNIYKHNNGFVVYLVTFILIGLLILYRHKENIKRLKEGKESKFKFKGNKG